MIEWYILVAVGVMACSVSQLLLKGSAIKNYNSWIRSIMNVRVLFAYGILFCSIPVNIMAMSHGVELKDIPILESLGYVFVPVLSYVIFNEKLKKNEIISILFIIIGVIIFYQ